MGKKEKCGHCVNYDMWCGICLNPQSERFKNEEDYIFDKDACEHYEFDKDNWNN